MKLLIILSALFFVLIANCSQLYLDLTGEEVERVDFSQESSDFQAISENSNLATPLTNTNKASSTDMASVNEVADGVDIVSTSEANSDTYPEGIDFSKEQKEVILNSCRIFLEANKCALKVSGLITAGLTCGNVFLKVKQAKDELRDSGAISEEEYQPMREEFHARKKICNKESFFGNKKFKCFRSLTIDSGNALIDHFSCNEVIKNADAETESETEEIKAQPNPRPDPRPSSLDDNS